MAERCRDGRVEAAALAANCDAVAGPDFVAERLVSADRMHDLAEPVGDQVTVRLARRLRLVAHLELGDFAAGDAEVERWGGSSHGHRCNRGDRCCRRPHHRRADAVAEDAREDLTALPRTGASAAAKSGRGRARVRGRRTPSAGGLSEQQATLAAREAERERAEAEVPRTKARMHEAGLTDTELIQPEERKLFDGTSEVLDNPDKDGVHNDDSRPPLRDR